MGSGLSRGTRRRRVRAAGRDQDPQARHGHRRHRRRGSATSGRFSPASTHPNIARLLDGGTTSDGLPYFAMEYVDGPPARRLLRDRAASTRRRGSQLFRQVCAAVQYAHQNLIIHRDLKPANMLVRDGRHAEAPRLRDREAPEPGAGGPHARADGGRHAADDAGVRQPRAGARRSGDDRDRRLLARRAALRAAHRPAALSHHEPGADRRRARGLRGGAARAPAPPSRTRPTVRTHSEPITGADARCRRARSPSRQPRAVEVAAPAPAARRRPRQHRPQGAEQGAGAPLRVGRSVLGRRAAPPRRASRSRAAGHLELSRRQVRQAPSRGGRRRCADVPRARRRHDRHGVAGARGAAARARAPRRASTTCAGSRTRSSSTFTTRFATCPARRRRGGCSCRRRSSTSTGWRARPADAPICSASWRRRTCRIGDVQGRPFNAEPRRHRGRARELPQGDGDLRVDRRGDVARSIAAPRARHRVSQAHRRAVVGGADCGGAGARAQGPRAPRAPRPTTVAGRRPPRAGREPQPHRRSALGDRRHGGCAGSAAARCSR